MKLEYEISDTVLQHIRNRGYEPLNFGIPSLGEYVYDPKSGIVVRIYGLAEAFFGIIVEKKKTYHTPTLEEWKKAHESRQDLVAEFSLNENFSSSVSGRLSKIEHQIWFGDLVTRYYCGSGTIMYSYCRVEDK